MEAQERDNKMDIDLEEIFKSPEESLYLTKEQMRKLGDCCNKLIKRIKDTPVEDIESGKVTQEQCLEWIKELQYESIAIADLFTDGKNNQKERLKNIEGKL